MTPERALGLPDSVLASLYSEWSEEVWSTSWMRGEEESFVDHLLSGYVVAELKGYEREGVRKIRGILFERTGE